MKKFQMNHMTKLLHVYACKSAKVRIAFVCVLVSSSKSLVSGPFVSQIYNPDILVSMLFALYMS